MPLYFTEKKKHWPPPKAVQYILAIALLLIAIFALGAWLFIYFGNTTPQPEETPQDGTVISPEDLPNAGYCLVIVEDAGLERFALVKTAPKSQQILVTALSADTATNEGTLSDVLKKHGPSRAAQSIADTLNLPMVHYMSFSINDLETLFTRWGNSLPLSIPEEVSYKDENGATIFLKAEHRKLTPSQIASLFRYDQWENSENHDGLAADVITAALNECLLPGKSLKGYFELLSNTAVTDLRIDQFNAYVIGWEYLVAANQGNVAQRGDTQ